MILCYIINTVNDRSFVNLQTLSSSKGAHSSMRMEMSFGGMRPLQAQIMKLSPRIRTIPLNHAQRSSLYCFAGTRAQQPIEKDTKDDSGTQSS